MLLFPRWTRASSSLSLRRSLRLRPSMPTLPRSAASFHTRSPSMMARILCSDPIHPGCPEILRQRGHTVDTVTEPLTPKELLGKIPSYDGLIVRSTTKVNKSVLEAASNLKVIGRAGVNMDNLDVFNATKHGVLVMNTPVENTTADATFTFGVLLALSRGDVSRSCSSLKEGSWEINEILNKGHDVKGKTVGIVGLGRIGREVAKHCNEFGMNVIGCDSLLSDKVARDLSIQPSSIEEIFSRSDFISLHLPHHSETKNLVNSDLLSRCKPDVRIINTSRTGIIDKNALLEAVSKGLVGSVALDIDPKKVQSDEVYSLLNKFDNVVCSPHIGQLSHDTHERIAKQVAYQMSDIMLQKTFRGVVNAPNVDFKTNSYLPPYILLGEKLGTIQAQLLRNNRVSKIKISSRGREVSQAQNAKSLEDAVLKGMLSYMLDEEEEVRFDNVRSIVDAMGITVVEDREEEVPSGYNHSNLLSVELELSNGKTIDLTGTVFGGPQGDRLRLISMNQMKMEVTPAGVMLFFQNKDQPGVLMSITNLISKEKVNISSFGSGRGVPGGTALGVLALDDTLDDEVVKEIMKLDHLSDVKQISLLDFPTLKYGRVEDIRATETRIPKPSTRPSSPNFGSGPCKKHPNYSLSNLSSIALGRSHRSKLGKSLLREAIVETKRLLKIPDDYYVGIVPASDTGAYEMAMWNLLGERPVDVCHWESFGKGWLSDITKELKLQDTVGVNEYTAEYGKLPDLSQTNPAHDICFTWNGTTSGVRVPNGDWIKADREGLTLNDATSAVFAMDIPWDKVDVTTFSWQKVLGGEGAHGMMVLSPRAVKRLETYHPDRPLPKIFRMKKGDGSFMKGIFDGSTINTPSMLCVEDYLDALRWTDMEGGVDALIQKSQRNLNVLEDFVESRPWIHFLAKDKSIRSNTSVCLVLDLEEAELKQLLVLLEREEIAVDIASYRDAPAGLRIWCGATVVEDDLKALCPWIEWAYNEVKAAGSQS